MATPNERIAAGLNAREAGPSLDKFAQLQGQDGTSRLPSPGMLRETAASARSKLKRLQDIARDVQKAAEAGRAEGERQAESLKSTLSKDQRRKVVANAESEARKTRAQHYAQERESILESLKGYSGQLDTMRSLWGSPAALLTSRVLGSEKSARYQQQLAHAGEAQLAVALRTAAATANSDLAYAALAACDARGFRPQDLVQASRDDVAAAVLGSAWTEMADSLQTLDRSTGDALTIERELQSGRRDPLATTARGLRQRGDNGEPAGEEGQDDE